MTNDIFSLFLIEAESEGSRKMHLNCPSCDSSHIQRLDRGKKAGGTIGFVGGAASGAVGAMNGARLGGTVGSALGPVGMGIGTIAGAILGGLMGGSAGGVAGAKLGSVIDERVLGNYRCRDCGQSFSIAAG